ncbi:MAG: ABC transporter permease [Cellvibrio sp.]|uniref:ABC transporter permease n=1 Tax=Cellvibrio sp. TaxID=1965322 RepID=UPI0031AA01D6
MFAYELRAAFYSLANARGYATTIVLTLGITLGALVAMFNLNYQLLAAPFPYPDADKIIVFKGERFHQGESFKDRGAPYPSWVATYLQPSDKLKRKALVFYTDSVERRLPDSPVLMTANVTPDFFNLFDVPMILGRRFNQEAELYAMEQVAIISYNTWQRIFQLDPEVLGKTLNIMEMEFKIIGVTAPDFIEPELRKPGLETDLWLTFDYTEFPVSERNNWNTSLTATYMVALPEEEYSLNAIEHEISTQGATLFKQEAASTNTPQDNIAFKLFSLNDFVLHTASKQSLLMLAGVMLLVLIASTNVINLILARAANKERTMAIQAALGAQPVHIFREILSEILLLMMAACALSIVVACGLLQALKVAADGFMPRLHELHLNGQTIVFAVVVALALAFLFAALVSRQINYRALNHILQSSGKGTGLQISKRARSLLILSQVALTGILLAVSLQVFVQSMREIHKPLGYEIKDQLQARLSVATLRGKVSSDEIRTMFVGLQQELSSRADVESVGLSTGSPVSYNSPFSQFLLTEFGGEHKILTHPNFCDGSYLEILKIPLVAGRYFTNAEAREHARVIVVNESLARTLQPDGNVLGKIVYRNGDTNPQGLEIIGVVKDLQIPVRGESLRFFQASVSDSPEVLIKMKPGKTLSAIEINQAAAKFHSQLKLFNLRTTELALNVLTANQKTAAYITAVLALLAFFLAAIGIYGVLSYSVRLRRFELGIRIAIGARPGSIVLRVFQDNLMPVVAGLISAFAVLLMLWIWGQQTSYSLDSSVLGWALPSALILLLAAAASLLSVWSLIRQPASEVLRSN